MSVDLTRYSGKIYILLCLTLTIQTQLFGQQASKKGTLTGIIIEDGSNSPLPFATVGIYSGLDSLVSGGLSDDAGSFEIELSNGQFYALVEFMGYEPYKSELFTISKESPSKDFGQIKLNNCWRFG